MKYIKGFIIFGWGLPLIASMSLLLTKVSCIAQDMLCSFPLMDVATKLLWTSLVWLIVVIVWFVKLSNFHK